MSPNLLSFGAQISGDNLNLDPIYEEITEVSGLFPVASYLNHSCSPNLEMAPSYAGVKAIFIAAKKIKKGEELTCNYSLILDPIARHRELYESFYFHCSCPFCRKLGL